MPPNSGPGQGDALPQSSVPTLAKLTERVQVFDQKLRLIAQVAEAATAAGLPRHPILHVHFAEAKTHYARILELKQQADTLSDETVAEINRLGYELQQLDDML